MQMIPLDQLKSLSSKKTLLEADSGKFSYDEFKKEYASILHDMQLAGAKFPKEAAFQTIVNGWIKDHCPPIRLIGKGSSRSAFACDDGICLKIAMNDQGVQQNKTEYENTHLEKDEQGDPVFAQSYEKANGYYSILTECCSKITAQQWQKMWAINDNQFAEAPESYLLVIAFALHENQDDWDKAIATLEKPQAEFAEKIKARKTAAMKVLATLFDFYADDKSNWDKLMPFDLCNEVNWGAAIRFGEVVPVILDAGFSSQTFDISKLMA